jgi:hypothetical protein
VTVLKGALEICEVSKRKVEGGPVHGSGSPHGPDRYFIYSGKYTGTAGNKPGSVISPPNPPLLWLRRALGLFFRLSLFLQKYPRLKTDKKSANLQNPRLLAALRKAKPHLFFFLGGRCL